MKFFRKVAINNQSIRNELPIFSTRERAQTGRRIGTDSLHGWPRAEQIDKIWLTGRWDVETSDGWEESGRASEEDYCVTGTGPQAFLDVNDNYYFPVHLFMYLFKQISFQTSKSVISLGRLQTPIKWQDMHSWMFK